jgi:hypothetical protein
MNNYQNNPQQMVQQPQMGQQPQMRQQPQMGQQPQMVQPKKQVDLNKVSKIIAILIGVLATIMMLLSQFTNVVSQTINLNQLLRPDDLTKIIQTTPVLWIGLVIAIAILALAIAGIVFQVMAKENKNTNLLVAFSLVLTLSLIVIIQTFRVNSDISGINSTISKIVEIGSEKSSSISYNSNVQQEMLSLGINLSNGISNSAQTVSQYERTNTLFQMSGLLTLILALTTKAKNS